MGAYTFREAVGEALGFGYPDIVGGCRRLRGAEGRCAESTDTLTKHAVNGSLIVKPRTPGC